MYNLKIHKINPPALNQTTSYWSWEPPCFPPSFFLLWMLAVILEAQMTFHWSSRTPFVPPLDLYSTQHAIKLCTCCREELLAHLACLQRYLSTWVVTSFGIWRDKVKNCGKIIKKVKATNQRVIFEHPVWTGAQEVHVHSLAWPQTSFLT